jgi:hypothetical protein
MVNGHTEVIDDIRHREFTSGVFSSALMRPAVSVPEEDAGFADDRKKCRVSRDL